jgi:hypothetical protein
MSKLEEENFGCHIIGEITAIPGNLEVKNHGLCIQINDLGYDHLARSDNL